MSALLALSTLATCSQGIWAVESRPGHTEPLTLWTLVSLPSGNRKTNVFATITKPLKDYEQSEAVRLSEEIRRGKSHNAFLEIQKQKLLQSIKSEADIVVRDEVILKHEQLSAEQIVIPRPLRLFTDDATPEALAKLLFDYGGKMAVLSDEGGIFQTLAGRYNSGGPNLDTCLKGYSAESPIRYDRKGDEIPIIIEKPYLTFGLCVQPSVLVACQQEDSFRGRGFLARFLFCQPKSLVGFRKLNTQPIEDDLKLSWKDTIFAILRSRSDTSVRVIRLSESAKSLLDTYSHEVEELMRVGGRFEAITDWASKLTGQVVRIAGLLHVCRYAKSEPSLTEISNEDMFAAVSVARVLEQHALIAFDSRDEVPGLAGARRIRDWIVRKGEKTFSARDAFNENRHFFKRMPNLTPVLEVLFNHGMIRPRMVQKHKVGRPSECYEVNPKLLLKQ